MDKREVVKQSEALKFELNKRAQKHKSTHEKGLQAVSKFETM